jgi:hypothetical protein
MGGGGRDEGAIVILSVAKDLIAVSTSARLAIAMRSFASLRMTRYSG